MLQLSHPCIHAAALMLQYLHGSILSPLSRSSIDAVALMMPYLCSRIHASAYTPPFLCHSMHAAAFTPLSCCSIGAVALTQQHWCSCSDAAASHATAFFGHSISQPTSRCSIHVVAFTLQLANRSVCAAALTGEHCRRKRTTRSAFSNAEHDASGRERARAGAGRARGGAGRGALFEKGCFGVGWGGVICTYISQKGVCDGGVKNRGWG